MSLCLMMVIFFGGARVIVSGVAVSSVAASSARPSILLLTAVGYWHLLYEISSRRN